MTDADLTLRDEVAQVLRRIYREHGHDDDWGVRVIYENQMRDHLADALLPLVDGRIAEAITSLYHPEFGTEWREDGLLYQQVRQWQAEAWDEGRAAERRDWEFTYDLSTPDEERQPLPNPYRDAT